MPIQIQEINDNNEASECPLCMEPLEVDDINFFPCVCGYQVCRFCWHRIRTDENGLCPACRTSYPENPAEFRPLTGSDLQKIRHEKRQKEVQRRQKLTDGRRHLAAIRVLQKNLVFVVGLSQRLSDAEVLSRQDYFGKYGKILKMVINSNTAYAGAQGPSCSAYVTYSKMEEALRAIQSVNNVHIDGRTLKASLGTTKYCSTYLKNQQCHKSDCMYLHELADEEASFTKEDMQAGKHQELEQRLIDQLIQKEIEAKTLTESLTSLDNPVSTEPEKCTTRSRRHSGSSGTTQPIPKQENSWIAGMSRSGDQGLSARLSSSLEEKVIESKNSAQRKTKKISPLHVDKAYATPPNDVIVTDSSRVSSECSSVVVTPPPLSSSPADDHNRLKNEPKGDTQNPEIEFTDTTPTVQLETSELNKPPKDEESSHLPDITEFVQATDSLFISKPEETPQPYKPFQRFNHPVDNNYTAMNSNFSLNNLLPQSFQDTTWNHQESNSQQLSDTTPIKSSNNWEEAFGFGNKYSTPPPQINQSDPPKDAGDDDLGFDPWAVCNQGFADLIEKESAPSHNHPSQTDGWNSVRPQQQPPVMHNPLPSMFSTVRPDQPSESNFNMKSSNGFPSAFSHETDLGLPPYAHHHHHHESTSFLSNSNAGKSNLVQSPTKNGLNAWQNGFRALLPSVNINFAMGSPSTAANTAPNTAFPTSSSVSGFEKPPSHNSSSGHGGSMLGYEDWMGGQPSQPQQAQTQSALFPTAVNRNTSLFHNGFGLNHSTNDRYSPVAPPPGLNLSSYHNDPAIISSGSKATLPQTPTLEETPHWMRSLQTLTDSDSSMIPSQKNSGLLPPANHPPPSTYASWPLSNNPALPPMSSVSQPPPGFQTRVPFCNKTTDFGIHHSLLENQS